MAELRGIALGPHLKAICSELRCNKSVYGHPLKRLFLGYPDIDFAADYHGRSAFTPVGPAAGPHTQLAQNIVLSFLAGGRIIELKTVQVLDALTISRPCIDMRNVGFNVEWSQELSLKESYEQYVTAWALLKFIEEMELLSIPKGSPFFNTVFDISVGYDLEGISSAKVSQWIEDMVNAEEAIARLLRTLPPEFGEYRRLAIEPRIANSVTLSTFHGCPRTQIESIVHYLIEEHDLNVAVKLNPTLLGYESVRSILCEELGYRHIQLDKETLEKDLSFEDCVAMMKRLNEFAASRGKTVSAKFTNTLVVKNHDRVFSDAIMYLSGRPLHVLAMNAMLRFRGAVGQDFPVSFSGGIDKKNVADAVSCHMIPVTACTDLLGKRGYFGLVDYLARLRSEMKKIGAADLETFMKVRSGNPQASVAEAGAINAASIVPELVRDPRYAYRQMNKSPRAVDTELALFDCSNCNLCLHTCPNAALFMIPAEEVHLPVTHFRKQDSRLEAESGDALVLERPWQIGVLADFCNECGNCNTFCPEQGAPYSKKPNFFFSRRSLESNLTRDGFCFEGAERIVGRVNQKECWLEYHNGPQDPWYEFQSDELTAKMSVDGTLEVVKELRRLSEGTRIDMTPAYVLRVLLDGARKAPATYWRLFLTDRV